VVVPTDKTNSFRTVSKSNYCKWVGKHLAKNAKEASKAKLADVNLLAQHPLHDNVELEAYSQTKKKAL